MYKIKSIKVGKEHRWRFRKKKVLPIAWKPIGHAMTPSWKDRHMSCFFRHSTHTHTWDEIPPPPPPAQMTSIFSCCCIQLILCNHHTRQGQTMCVRNQSKEISFAVYETIQVLFSYIPDCEAVNIYKFNKLFSIVFIYYFLYLSCVL